MNFLGLMLKFLSIWDFQNCSEIMIINSSTSLEGYITTNNFDKTQVKHVNDTNEIECIIKFFGQKDERIQIVFDIFDLYYSQKIQKYNKVE